MISIAMSYYNRLSQLNFTLDTIRSTRVREFEIIIVEDFCDQKHSLDHIATQHADLPITVIRMRDLMPEKTYCNPCIPYNVALRACKGDRILIQNPECAHMGDVLYHFEQNASDDVYLSYHCYAATKAETLTLQSGQPMQMFTGKKSRWYNHAQERPLAYHFAAGITRRRLCELNGFDERYAQGFDMDDVDLVHRVRKLGLEIQFVSDPWVVHQYHAKTYINPYNPEPSVDNRQLWAELKENLVVRAQAKDICGI